jgi:1-phosphatidylinositol-4-phosphate 5-kinase
MSIMSDDYQEYFIPDSISVMRSLDDSHLYYFGIIDILTNFSAKKKLEYVAKRVVYGPTVSAIPPQDYAQRFYEFMTKIFDDNKVLTVRESRVLKR